MKVVRVQGRAMTKEEREALKDFALNYDRLVAEDIRIRYSNLLERKRKEMSIIQNVESALEKAIEKVEELFGEEKAKVEQVVPEAENVVNGAAKLAETSAEAVALTGAAETIQVSNDVKEVAEKTEAVVDEAAKKL
jgi:myosin heavy subunit